jgi:filamentous hemagglutinin family protein
MPATPIPKTRRHLPITFRAPMKVNFFHLAILAEVLISQPVNAQIIPDNTLPVNSNVTPIGNVNIIEGGTTRGSNLFHSFYEFSVFTGTTAYFNNSVSVQNIFARVTGGSGSSIDGVVRANGTANFFLLNPSGILFGPNARLNLGGSFLASTGETIIFSDGMQFSTKNSQNMPLLSINVPVAIVFGIQPGEIRLQGPGHTLEEPFFLPVIGAGNSTSGLRVNPGNTLALLGGEVNLNGGILTAPGGHVEVGSVKNGSVGIDVKESSWKLDYSKIFDFSSIDLLTRSLIDASGLLGGSIQIQGGSINLQDGSVILIQNQGLFPSKGIIINATDSLKISGTDPIAKIIGGILTFTLGAKSGGDITISTPHLKLINGGTITTATYTTGNAGNINLTVLDTLEIIGASPLTPGNFSSITTFSVGSGSSGNINVKTGNLLLKDGGSLFSIIFNSGNAGDIKIDVSQSVNISGVDPENLLASTISSVTFGSGNAGEILVNTPKLILEDGGSINSSTLASGRAGDIIINASDYIKITGFSINPSIIISSAGVANAGISSLFELPILSGVSGDSGTIVINTDRLLLNDTGTITVSNIGKGTAGSININAKSVELNKGRIAASTTSGNGGNINLDTQFLSLLNNSELAASASGFGRGGNIDIFSDIIVGDSTSAITASSVNNFGGNIAITSDLAVFAPGFKTSATSGRGTQFDGRVTINSNSVLPIISPPTTLQSPEAQPTITCDLTKGKLVLVGTGGIPETLKDSYNPDDFLIPEPVQTSLTYTDPDTGEKYPFQEAVGWKNNPDGTISFVTDRAEAVQFAQAQSQCLQSTIIQSLSDAKQ